MYVPKKTVSMSWKYLSLLLFNTNDCLIGIDPFSFSASNHLFASILCLSPNLRLVLSIGNSLIIGPSSFKSFNKLFSSFLIPLLDNVEFLF